MDLGKLFSENKQIIAAVVAGLCAIAAAYIRRDRRFEKGGSKRPVLSLLLMPVFYLLLGVGLLAAEFFSVPVKPEGDLSHDNPGAILCLAGCIFVVAGVVWLPLDIVRLLTWPKPKDAGTSVPATTPTTPAVAAPAPTTPASPRKPEKPRAGSGFLVNAIVWVLVIGVGTAGSNFYKKWIVKERELVQQEQLDPLERKFKEQWYEALDTCADPPSVEAYVRQAPFLYRGQFQDNLQRIDDTWRNKHPRIKLAFDSFSGYCVLRSRAFQARLGEGGVRVHLVDDKADYDKRIKNLKSGETPVAVFTIDALINNSAQFDSPPAAIVLVIDESRGADALVGYKDGLPDLQALNHKDARIVLTPDSPSELLARLVRSNHNLPDLPKECFINANDAQDVYARFNKTDPQERVAFVLWEPFVSRLLQESPKAHKLIDSATEGCGGYIVDVLVVQKDFLQKNKKNVERIVKAYLEAAAMQQQTPEDRSKLVQADSALLTAAGKLSKELTPEEVSNVVKGIRWKNTQDNYAHFDLLAGAAEDGKLDKLIEKITTVLIKTKKISRRVDESLVDKSICADLQKENFDERKALLVKLPPVPFNPQKDWNQLKDLPDLKNEPISFRPASSVLSSDSIETLQEAVKALKAHPECYLEIQGIPKGSGPIDAALAQERADEVLKWLRVKGRVEEQRLKARTVTASRDDGGKVTFVFKKPPR